MTKPLITHLRHVAIAAPDLDRQLAFYRDLWGLSPAQSDSGVHFLAALLWSRGARRALDLSIYFRRPIFWDERFTSGVLGDAEDISSWKGLCLLRNEGDAGVKVLTEASIQTLVVEGDPAAG